LLGLFFMSVGMGMDARLIAANWLLLLAAAPALVVVKIAVAYGLERWSLSPRIDALRSAALLSPAGEFSYVLIPLARVLGLLTNAQASLATALAALTMVIGPVATRLIEVAIARREAARPQPQFDLAA